MSGNIFKSLATVSGMTMVSRVLGFVRQIFMAGIVGAGGSPVADAFWAAFRLPNMFRRLFAEGAFHAAFIPMFQGKRTQESEAAAKEFAEEVLIGLIFILSILTALVEIFAPLAVSLLASGFENDPEKFALTTLYTRITSTNPEVVMPRPRANLPPVTAAEAAVILDWIKAGAPQ